MGEGRQSNVRWLLDLELAWELAWLVALATVGPLLVALWLDRRLHTTPCLTLLGVIFGLGLTFRVVQRRMKGPQGAGQPQRGDFHRDVKEDHSCGDC